MEFDEVELIDKAIKALNKELRVPQIFIKVEAGTLLGIDSKEQLERGEAMSREKNAVYQVASAASIAVKFDLVCKIVAETGLTRKAVVNPAGD